MQFPLTTNHALSQWLQARTPSQGHIQAGVCATRLAVDQIKLINPLSLLFSPWHHPPPLLSPALPLPSSGAVAGVELWQWSSSAVLCPTGLPSLVSTQSLWSSLQPPPSSLTLHFHFFLLLEVCLSLWTFVVFNLYLSSPPSPPRSQVVSTDWRMAKFFSSLLCLLTLLPLGMLNFSLAFTTSLILTVPVVMSTPYLPK